MKVVSKIRFLLPPTLPFLYLVFAYIFDGFFLRPNLYLEHLSMMKAHYSMPFKFLLAYGAMFVSILLLLSFIYSLPKVGKHIFAFLCCLSFGICMSYFELLGRFPNDGDLTAAIMAITTRREEILGLFSSFFPMNAVIFSVSMFLFLEVAMYKTRQDKTRQDKTRQDKTRSLCFGILFLPTILVWMFFGYRYSGGGLNLEPFSHLFRLTSFRIQEWYEFGGITRDKFNTGKISIPQNSIVLIVDESVRADYLDINTRGIGTSPWLAEFAKRDVGIRNYGIAVSAATSSFASGVCLLTGVHIFPDVQKRSQRNPILFDIAKMCGYKTNVHKLRKKEDNIEAKTRLRRFKKQMKKITPYSP